MRMKYKFAVLIILMIFLVSTQALLQASGDDIDIAENEYYSWLSDWGDIEYYSDRGVEIITDERLCIEDCEQVKGWNIRPYNELEGKNAESDAIIYLSTYPADVIGRFVDKIYMVDKLKIRNTDYAGTIVDKSMYTAIDITENSSQIWIKMVLAHEFFHIREEYYKSGDEENNPYHEMDRLIDEYGLEFYYNEGYSFRQWSELVNRKYSEKNLEMGYIREYSLYASREFKANIAQAVDMGAYKILAEKSEEVKSLMDAYIEGNIRLFKEMGYELDGEYYREHLPDRMRSTDYEGYKKLITLYSFSDSGVLDRLIDRKTEIIIGLAFLYLVFRNMKKFLRVPLDEESIQRKKKWESIF
ncbi:hypothetical protein SAMN02745751_02542 [Dethiosulfatibacter aminovorans DSM 17477]|uniref:Peptidase MA superfamily protein n=2 Tax=Dethiosulfatibacter TaxID=448125 RepID=A0A1M6J872_9FIRM|nr:hypothetical protein SAMN02745751_02542 [Dethiosulfatibacter aminovorans DSM 17477]